MQSNDMEELRTLKGLVIDMDGVLWQGDVPMPGLHELFDALQKSEVKFILATNNNTQTPQGFVEKAGKMGLVIHSEQVINAAVATVHYLCSSYPPGCRVYVVGEAALKGLISDAGFTLADKDVRVVVATMDRQLTYDMLKRATLLLRAGADFVVPNNDPSYPTPEGIVPGGGAIVAAIAVASDRQPLVIGKPESWMFQFALERMNLNVDETASLGDRISTDIVGGHRMGMRTILTLGGVSTLADVETSPVKPTWIFSGIDELAKALLEE